MSSISGNENLPGAEAQPSARLKALLYGWRLALAEIRASLLRGDRRRRTDANQRDDGASECVPESQVTQVAEDAPERTAAEPPGADADGDGDGDGDAGERALVPLPDDRSQALAHLCDRLLEQLDAAEVKAAEIRFVVHKHEHPAHPLLDPDALAVAGDAELVWEMRRLIAWSGGTIADVVQALETRGADLDENARELLRDEVAALDVDLATLNVLLAGPVNWDREFECLLAGEVAPFDDVAGDEDEENDANDV
jgi:hypothetical protein